MKTFILTLKWRSLFAAALLTTSLSVLAEGDEQAIRDAAADFYQALNSMFKGDLESMEAVWSHAADITYMGPTGGLHLGWSAVLKDWQLQAAMKLGGSVEPLDMQIFVGEQLAITQNYEKKFFLRNIDLDANSLHLRSGPTMWAWSGCKLLHKHTP